MYLTTLEIPADIQYIVHPYVQGSLVKFDTLLLKSAVLEADLYFHQLIFTQQQRFRESYGENG